MLNQVPETLLEMPTSPRQQGKKSEVRKLHAFLAADRTATSVLEFKQQDRDENST